MLIFVSNKYCYKLVNFAIATSTACGDLLHGLSCQLPHVTCNMISHVSSLMSRATWSPMSALSCDVPHDLPCQLPHVTCNMISHVSCLMSRATWSPKSAASWHGVVDVLAWQRSATCHWRSLVKVNFRWLCWKNAPSFGGRLGKRTTIQYTKLRRTDQDHYS